MRTMLIPGILVFIFISCQTTRYSSPESFQGKQIIISESGGFSGQTTQHIILENGQVFSRTSYPESIKEDKVLEKKTVHEIFDRFNRLNFSEIDFQHPGNMTYSLAFREGKEYHEVKWGDPAYTVPQSVLECYQFISSHINQK